MTNVVLGITGGIGACKAASAVTALQKHGYDVRVVMTDNATHIVSQPTLATLTKNPVLCDMWDSPSQFATVDHIEIAQWADAFVVYPTTANTLAKFAHGVADNILTTIFLALPTHIPKVLFPSMNTAMWNHWAVQQNVERLREHPDITVITPAKGMLACGVEGVGKTHNVQTMVFTVGERLKRHGWWFPLSGSDVQVPVPPHVGSYGHIRKYHTHEGVDLYAPEGTPVYAVEDGLIVNIERFTGPNATPPSPWWNDTYAVLVEGKSGVVVYGEIAPISDIMCGKYHVATGDCLGYVKQVLKKDKGRPMSMLHVELHEQGTLKTKDWPVTEDGQAGEKPATLLDPTEYLLNAKRWGMDNE